MTSDRQATKRTRRAPRPLDAARLDELALTYVARFATTATKLERYLKRKLRERGWEGEGDAGREPDLAALVGRYVELGYVDDASWARARGWAVSIAAMEIPYYRETRPEFAARSVRAIESVLAEQ